MSETEDKKVVCVFCKDCDKPFSVAVAEFAALDKDWSNAMRKYKKQGYRVELVENFDGVWCECFRGKATDAPEETQLRCSDEINSDT